MKSLNGALKPGGLLSVVVIGLNEELRLQSCLRSVFDNCPENWQLQVVYVDSGSTDSSVQIASSFEEVQVIGIGEGKRSAARARNAGIRLARGEFIQLLDGDSVLQPGWLSAAAAYLQSNDKVASVFGHCVEMFPHQSIYMSVCGLDWFIPPGDHRLCGGNAMWRTAKLIEMGGFDEAFVYGEEPDLSVRVRKKGDRIVCIDKAMVLHDLQMLRFHQYWQRAQNNGRAYAKIAWRYRNSIEKMWLRESIRNFVEPITWFAIVGAGTVLGGLAVGIGALTAFVFLRAARIALRVRARVDSYLLSASYGIHCQFVKLPIAIGQAKEILSLLSNRV